MGNNHKRNIGRFTIADVTVDADHNRLERDGAHCELEPRVMDVLTFLMLRHGEVLSRDRIIEGVWDNRVVGDDVVNRAVFEIRRGLRSLGMDTELIRTVRGRGYEWLVAPVPASASQRAAGPRRIAQALFGLLLIAVATWLFWSGKPVEAVRQSDPGTVVTLLPTQSDRWPESLRSTVRALHEMIRTALSSQAIVVIRERMHGEDSYRLDLGPSVDGGLMSRLFDPNGREVWSAYTTLDPVDRTLGDYAAGVARGTLGALGHVHEPVPPCPFPTSPGVGEEYFEARRLIGLRGRENLEIAIKRLEALVESEPAFSQAWSTLAHAYETLPVYINGDEGVQASGRLYPMATAAAQKALALCERDALAQMIAGPTPGYGGSNRWIVSEMRLRRALVFDANNAEMLRHYADMLYRVGHTRRSLEVLEQAYLTDPGHARLTVELAAYNAYLYRLDRAETLVKTARAMGTRVGWPMLEFSIALKRGDRDQAMRLIADYPREEQEIMAALVAYELGGEIGARDRFIAAGREAMMSGSFGAMSTHITAVSLGESDLAYEAFGRIRLDQYNLTSLWMEEGTAFRADPRFLDIVTDLELPEFWAMFGPPDVCQTEAIPGVCSDSPPHLTAASID